jgi:glycyl-tRNA synthetase beta chain
VGFWAIDEKPTGSKDPYALRRAALGAVRLILANNLSIGLSELILDAGLRIERQFNEKLWSDQGDMAGLAARRLISDSAEVSLEYTFAVYLGGVVPLGMVRSSAIAQPLLSFFHDRLKVYLRDSGKRHDIVDAVLTSDADDLLMVVRRAEALAAFIDSEDGKNLLAGTKRATQLLAAEEKKGTKVADRIELSLLALPAEQELHRAIVKASGDAASAVAREDFAAAMEALSKLRGPVDAFFDQVLVNDENPDIRANRLALLAAIRAATATVADFSKISG